ncbi:hypothetical protein AWZ03_009411 [Drosophila navojoa]|uniref:Uncharacterized protein n=1 Tax=Drosophila navojoa TaxID=7232 RepID=A0A484B8L2_DRONA|nr:hypothetical protein AWZ03_009411 [Drosophila navojoa]
MLSATQKSTPPPPLLPPPPKQTHRQPQMLGALHVDPLDAVDKGLQFACHLLWQLIVGLPTHNHRATTGVNIDVDCDSDGSDDDDNCGQGR